MVHLGEDCVESSWLRFYEMWYVCIWLMLRYCNVGHSGRFLF